jgi:hypothetical protein
MRKLAIPFTIISIFISVYLLFIKKIDPQAEKTILAQKNEIDNIKSSLATALSSHDATVSQEVSVDQSHSTETTEIQKEKIQKWISVESKNLNQPHVDTAQKDIELKRLIESYSESDKKVIFDVALDTNRTANERILSTYMLVLDQSQQSINNLGNLAQKVLHDFGPTVAHSESEIRRGQELAVRYMAIDELRKRAKNDPLAVDALKKLAASAESAEIRNYAQRALSEIK